MSAGTIGFKEWQVVCDALGDGRQRLILRKGGIHEGREGFSFAHDAFFLFPTRFHADASQVRGDVGGGDRLPEWREGDAVRITHHARALRAVTLTDWDAVAELEPWHILSEGTVRDRFHWQGRNMPSGSIHVAVVEVHKLATPWELAYHKSFGGCRSWITLPDPPPGVLEHATPAVSAEELAGLLPGPANPC